MFNHVNGPPGNGKTSLLAKEMEKELIHTKRNLPHNLHLRYPEVMTFFLNKYPRLELDILRRMEPLTWTETLFWYRFRGKDAEGSRVIWTPKTELVWVVCRPLPMELPWSESVEKEYPGGVLKEKLTWPEAGDDDPGCCAFLDEWQEHWDQNSLNEFTREHCSALNQHRKFKLDAWIGSPFLSQIAKPYREISQSFYTVENLGYQQRGYGKFNIRLPTKFLWNKYRRPPGGLHDKPFLMGHFSLDVDGIHSIFNTAAGVGVANQEADEKIEREGGHWWKGVVFVVVVAWLIWTAYRNAGTGVLWFLGQKVPESAAVAKGVTNTVVPVKPVVMMPARSEILRPRSLEATVRWVARSGDYLTFGLSDGRTLRNPRGVWTGQELLYEGRVYRYEPNYGPAEQPKGPR